MSGPPLRRTDKAGREKHMATTPPFRADHVGSLLRPADLREARARAKAGAISSADLRAVEDRSIRAAVAKQESLGLHVVTDGEYRRDFWHLDFLRQFDGVGVAPVTGMKFEAEDVPPMPAVTGKVRCSRPIMADHFRYLASVATRAVPKLTIPAPAMLHLRGGRRAISSDHYPDLAAFWTDVAAAYRAAIGHIAAAGCAYLQLDDVSFSYLCDPRVRDGFRAGGDDPATLPRTYAEAINQALAGRPAGMTVTMHTCRGNFRSTWLASGKYEDAVVEAMFSTDVDAYFMEWDSERAGGFEPLRLLPGSKKVVLGLVTTKSGALESRELLARRIDEASRYVPLEHLCLSPQCGFASTHHGNTLTEDFLGSLVRSLARRPEAREASVLLLAACQLGGVSGHVPSELAPSVDATVREFLDDERESKPLGFYTWNSELERMFRQDRLLQRELSKESSRALGDALRSDPGLLAAYDAYLTFVSRLTNPLAKHDLRRFAADADQRPPSESNRPCCFFPPSMSHEGELAKRLYGDRPIPDGFSLIDEVIRRVRARTLTLEPSRESGWYDYQTWSHEPLVIPEETPEAGHLLYDDSYRRELLDLFKGAQALARETHVKQLKIVPLGMADPGRRRATIAISPGLTVEPLATFYHRRAQGYRFVRGILEDTFGAEALRQMRRLTLEGPVDLDLYTELEHTEALFRGAHASAAAQIGMAPDMAAGHATDTRRFRAWVESLASDPDLGRDARMMVPIFYDALRRKTKVWVFLGWVARTLRIDFATLPEAQVFDADGRPVSVGEDLELDFIPETHTLLSPVTAEVYVTELLNRDEFRAHCDRLRTRSAILSALR